MYTRTHEILRPRVRTEAPEPSTSGASDEFVFVRIGLADRAFDEIGDVKAIAAVAAGCAWAVAARASGDSAEVDRAVATRASLAVRIMRESLLSVCAGP